LFETRDYGQSWSQDTVFSGVTVLQLLVTLTRAHGVRLYVVQENVDSITYSKGVTTVGGYVTLELSKDGGRTFNPAGGLPPYALQPDAAIAADPADGERMMLVATAIRDTNNIPNFVAYTSRDGFITAQPTPKPRV